MVSFSLAKLSLEGVLADVPHDTAAVVTYALLVLFIGFVWSGSRHGA